MGLYHTFIVYQNINSIVQIGTYAYIYLSTPNYIHQCYPICSRFVSPTRQGSLLNNLRLMLYPHWSCSKTVDPTCSRGMWQMKKALLSGSKENWKMPELTDKPEISLDKQWTWPRMPNPFLNRAKALFKISFWPKTPGVNFINTGL